MLFTICLAVTLASAAAQGPVPRDSTKGRVSSDTSYVSRRRRDRRPPKVRPLTPELDASAYEDATARTLIGRARVARMSQDSTLVGYDATTYQRISVGMGLAKLGRDRLLFRNESSAHVHWRRNAGAWVEVTGNRTAMPTGVDDDDDDPDMRGTNAPIPYFPGHDPLWIGGEVAKASVDEREIVNPMAGGSEAYYTYRSGDSVSIRLPSGTPIRLREVLVRPRQPQWNLVVGSLWFDVGSGQLVRAAYRLSVPIDVWDIAKQEDSTSMNDVPIWVRPLVSPIHAEVAGVAVEYSLHNGRYWLPSIRAAEGSAQVSFMRVPFKFEQSFKYADVNGDDTLPTRVLAALEKSRASMARDSAAEAYRSSLDSAGRAAYDQRQDSLRKARRDSVTKLRRDSMRVARASKRDTATKNQAHASGGCALDSSLEFSRDRTNARLAIVVDVPCDTVKLARSPDLPPSIFDPGDQLFGVDEQKALMAEALSLGAQPPLQFSLLRPPTFDWGAQFMRFNRVEGASAGAQLQENIGEGYTATALGRLGFSDLRPNAELTVTRTNLSQAVHLSGYRRLVSAGDWGNPLSFGSGLSAALFGHDDGFYYYATGAELGGEREALFGSGAHAIWRVFAERQSTAPTQIQRGLFTSGFGPDLAARNGWYEGASLHLLRSYGLDPNGFRLLTDGRLEAAYGDSVYGRGALDLTGSHGLGALAAALTLSGGTSVGALPPQRRWYLGGLQTVRGQTPDTAQSGNAYWFTRAELGLNNTAVRPVVFGDLGWVGDRAHVSNVGRPMSGVGAGLSFFDGLFRFDMARGLYPRKQWRADLSVEARF